MNPIEEKHYMNNEDQKSYENLGDAIVHATITKETAVGFNWWVWLNCEVVKEIVNEDTHVWFEYKGEKIDKQRAYKLYNIYVESLKQ